MILRLNHANWHTYLLVCSTHLRPNIVMLSVTSSLRLLPLLLFVVVVVCHANSPPSPKLGLPHSSKTTTTIAGTMPTTTTTTTAAKISAPPTQTAQTAAATSTIGNNNPCDPIEQAFSSAVKQGEAPVCQCIVNVPPQPTSSPPVPGQQNVSPPSTGERRDQFWIGCTRHKMTAVFRALQTLNGTRVPHLHIWDSLINILPNEPSPMFTQLLADRLTIERSRVALIREGAFAIIGQTLRGLSLRHNILKGLEERAFVDLAELRELDLGWNKLGELRHAHFARMGHLERLVLAGNQIARLEDGLFQPLVNLRVLNLANNNIRRITKHTFKGLANLEVLILTANKLGAVDADAFVHLKALKVLELDNNQLTGLALRGNTALERLMLNNNSISDLAHLSISGLTGLRSLHLDNNNITSIFDADLRGLADSASLAVLSLDANNISRIDCRAFASVSQLSVLSLQHNRITSLSCSASHDPISLTVSLDQPFLEPLQKLSRLLLSHNMLQRLGEDDLAGLGALRELSLDYNNIFKIARNAFAGLQLRKLFLNNNQLYYLPRGVFSGWNLSNVQAVDLSGNNWECICEQEWIGAWLKALGKADTHFGSLGCLDSNQCENVTRSSTWFCGDDADGGEEQPKSATAQEDEDGVYVVWIRLVACVLAFAAILFLAIAAYVYMQEYWHTVTIHRTSSDTIRLLPSVESLFTVPNPPIVLGAGAAELSAQQQQQPHCHSLPYVGAKQQQQQRCTTGIVATSIAINALGGGRGTTTTIGGGGGAVERKEDGKKRVRFQ